MIYNNLNSKKIEGRRAKISELNIIHTLAHKIWPPTFGEILSDEQMSYMLEMMYSIEALHKQVAGGVEFYIFKDKDQDLGYCGIEHNLSDTKIHKLYLLPDYHGRGFGRVMMDFISARATSVGSKTLTLNVNRFNPAVAFYKHYGYEIVKVEDIDIGNGYLMEDYKMEYSIQGL